MSEATPCCLTIAGSDSGGNAGVQADLRAFHAYGLHGCTVLAALTAQNPNGVAAVHAVPPDFVAAQLDAVLGVYDIKALKTGMLADPAVVEAVGDRVAAYPGIARVVDPVMVATSGAKLAEGPAVEAMKRCLLPLATVVTPNIPEAVALCGREGGAAELAKSLQGTFGCAVVVKGGHGSGGEAVDVLCDKTGEVREFSLPRIESPVSTHGTGCTFAAALAAELALGHGVAQAIEGAKRHVHSAIARSYLVGDRCGVLGFAEEDGDDD